ncbi:MAG TPA: hypothetical protein VFM88_12740, partial [Vicinamibacteria bacterium]|nr:hypothetical protein [Vicinamibacteria bacterium]
MRPKSAWDRSWSASVAAAATAALLPFARPLLGGEAFFFRDITRTFFPIKRFVGEGLSHGELRFWNPLLHEGVPLHMGPFSYPIDLLHALCVDERFFTVLLALHVPLGAVGFVLLARRLGCSPVAAAGGAVTYALGGFSLSCVNLYVYAQALGWAPFVAHGLVAAAERGGRSIALAALPVWLGAATGGIEVFAQSVLLGLVLAAGRPLSRLCRCLAAVALGIGLAGPALLVPWAQLGGSARAGGLPAAVVVAHSVHPWTLPQLLIGNWHGDLMDVANRWWGANFFPLGFPYVLSLYLGAAALALAIIGALSLRRHSGRLAVLLAVSLFVCLGRFAGLEPVVEALPLLRVVRFPVKAFFGVHACLALLLALGLEALGANARLWRRVAFLAGGLGAVLVALSAVPALAPPVWTWFLGGFMPPEHGFEVRVRDGELILGDAVRGGLVAVLLAGTGWLVARGRLAPARGALLAAALVGADLLRAGAGLNPTVSAGFFRLSPEMERVASALRATGGRAFSCDPEASPAYFAARSVRRAHDAWSFAVSMETLTPNLNVGFGVKTALSRDLTMMVPEARVLLPEQTSPKAVPRLVERLRAAGVTRVLCVDPVESAGLLFEGTLRPARLAPLAVHVYAVSSPRPLRSVEGSPGRILSDQETTDAIELEVEVDAPATVVVRDAVAPGWRAFVNGAAAPIRTVEGHYRGLDVDAGRSRVSMRYRPPGLR